MNSMNMKNLKFCLIVFIFFVSCEYQNPAFRFSNFYGSIAENIAKAIEKNNIEGIRTEVLENKINIDFKDEKYEVSLLSLAIVNNKRKAFDELLELGVNPNVENTYCGNPLNLAIRYNNNCDLYFVNHLLNNGADITPRFFEKCNYFSRDPIIETIHYYSDEKKVKCGQDILMLLTSKLDNPDLLFMYNDAKNYQANIVFNCLSTQKNISALKYLIVDLKYKVPKKIFIDGTVILNQEDGFKSLEDILNNREFVFEYSEIREQAKKDILTYLNKNNEAE